MQYPTVTKEHSSLTGRVECSFIVTIQPFGFIATKACTQTAKTAVWRVAASGLPCKCKATPRGTVEG